MVLYNVTVSIDPTVKEEWLEWMRSKHIPDVMQTGCFIESRISRVHGDEEGGETFAITYLAKSHEEYERYKTEFSKPLQEEHGAKYQGKFGAFRTILSLIEEFK